MAQPNYAQAVVSNLFVKQILLPNIGDKEQTHSHNFDSIVTVASGSVKCTVVKPTGNTQPETTNFTAPHLIYIKADYLHGFEAMSSNTVLYAIHALRDNSGNVIPVESVPLGVDPLTVAAPIRKRKGNLALPGFEDQVHSQMVEEVALVDMEINPTVTVVPL